VQPLTEGRDRIKEARIAPRIPPAHGFTHVTSQIIKMQIIVLFLVMAVVAQAFRMRLVLPQTRSRARFRRFPDACVRLLETSPLASACEQRVPVLTATARETPTHTPGGSCPSARASARVFRTLWKVPLLRTMLTLFPFPSPLLPN